MKEIETVNYFNALTKIMLNIDLRDIDHAVEVIRATIAEDRKIFACGNGGSAYAASHYITDWNKMYTLAHGARLKGISLCDNIGSITAYGNDLDYTKVFSGQLRSLGNEGDLLIIVSGSGNSPNVIDALYTARELGIRTMAFVGYDGGKCLGLAQSVVHIPSFDMQFCEDIHLMLGHIIMKKLCNYEIVE